MAKLVVFVYFIEPIPAYMYVCILVSYDAILKNYHTISPKLLNTKLLYFSNYLKNLNKQFSNYLLFKISKFEACYK